MKVKIKAVITKATSRKNMEHWHDAYKNRVEVGDGNYDYLVFGPITIEPSAIDELTDLLAFVKGPDIVRLNFIDIRNGGVEIEPKED